MHRSIYHNSRSGRVRLLLSCLLLLTGQSVATPPDMPELSHHFTLLNPEIAAPDFALADMDGEQHRLADYRGKVIHSEVT